MKIKVIIFFSLLLTIAFYGTWMNSTVLENTDYKLYDILTASNVKTPPTNSTAIVEIDEKSLQVLGQWPWPRVITAELLKKMGAARPAAISFDLIFPEKDRTSPITLNNFYNDFFNFKTHISGLPTALEDNDKIFAEAIKNQNVILPVFFNTLPSIENECPLSSISYIKQPIFSNDLYSSSYLLCNLPIIQKQAKAIGHIQASPDPDGVLRRIPLFINYKNLLIPTLGLTAIHSLDPNLELKQSNKWIKTLSIQVSNHTFTTDEKTNVLLQFYPPKAYSTVSAIDVLNGDYNTSLLQGKFILIGATAMGLHDHYTLSDGSVRPGVFAHATLIENIVNDALLSQPSVYKKINIFLSLLSALYLMALIFKKKYLHTLFTFFILTTVSILISYTMLTHNLYISVGYFVIPLVSYVFAISIILFFINYRDKKIFFEEMSKANAAMIDSMALVAETRDIETGAHIVRTKRYIKLLANYLTSRNIYTDILTPSYILNLYHAAPLHDIGKVGIPDEILKKDGKLTVDEFEIMKTHSLLGKEIVKNAMLAYRSTPMLEIAYNISHSHHEKWDGSGYPLGLIGDKIPLEARLMALADVYDALISKRCYKLSFSYEDSENIIFQGKGTHFDPILVDAFFILKEEFRMIAEEIK